HELRAGEPAHQRLEDVHRQGLRGRGVRGPGPAHGPEKREGACNGRRAAGGEATAPRPHARPTLGEGIAMVRHISWWLGVVVIPTTFLVVAFVAIRRDGWSDVVVGGCVVVLAAALFGIATLGFRVFEKKRGEICRVTAARDFLMVQTTACLL